MVKLILINLDNSQGQLSSHMFYINLLKKKENLAKLNSDAKIKNFLWLLSDIGELRCCYLSEKNENQK